MSHTITITRLPDEDNDDADYAIDGECTPACRVWRGCKRKACQRMNPDYPPFDERNRHGVEHQRIDGEWMVETNDCGIQYADDVAMNADDVTELGTYELRVDWDGDSWLTNVGGIVHACTPAKPGAPNAQ